MVVTWDAVNKGSAVTLSNNNLTATIPGNAYVARATEGKTSGKWYWEIKFEALNNAMTGIVRENTNLNSIAYNTSGVAFYYTSGNKYPGASAYGQAYSVSNIISVLLDMDLGTIEFWRDGISQGVMFNNLKDNPSPVYAAITSGSGSTGSTTTARFNIDEFTYQPPEGYLAYDGTRKPVNKILLSQENENVISIKKGEYSENLIPPMTNNTTPSGEAKVSTLSSSGYKLFDGVKDAGTLILSLNGWIQYKFQKPTVINKYTITPINFTYSPKSWRFEGSNDESTWDVLDTRSDITDWGQYTQKDYTFSNTNEYLYYRVFLISSNSSQFHISEVEMMTLNSSNVYQLPNYSEQNFKAYGMNSPVQVDEIFTNKNYILQDTVSEDTEGLWTTKINRKPLSIKFN